MRKTCTCGNQKFFVDLREYDAHARTSQSTNMVTEIRAIECTECGKTYKQ